MVHDPTGGVFRYVQKTWHITDNGEADSHHQTGFIGSTDDGHVLVISAQGLDSAEVLSGIAVSPSVGPEDRTASVVIAHDERMHPSWRETIVFGDTLTYTMGMATPRCQLVTSISPQPSPGQDNPVR